MLSGMIAPTSGDAYIFGQSIITNMSGIRRILGVVPQHNILYDLLTVREHLELFAAIKGVPRGEVDSQIDEMIAQVGLTEKVNDKAAALEDAIDLGFSRILTSGGKPTAHEGMEMLEQLINQAQDRIIIMPGSGVRPQNAAELLKRLRATELHASCSVRFTEGDAQLVELSFASREMLRTDASTVRQLKQILYSHVEARLASS